MKNGTIILTISGRSSKWYARLVVWFIRKASGYEFDHTRGVIDGWTYETRHPDGFVKTKGHIQNTGNTVFLEPIKSLTKKQSETIKAYFDQRIENNRPYNYPKLFLSLLLYWSRPFWELIKWVPFQDDTLWGDHCSSAWDCGYKAANIDLLPGYEEITSPGDFMKSKLLRIVGE